MTDHANELRRHARKIPHPQGETPGVMLRAADEIECLRAKIEQMERQEPVAWGVFHFGGKRNGKLYSHCESEKQARMYILDRHQSDDSNTFREAPLYAIPSAQPAPSVPDDVMRDANRYRFLRAAKNIPISTEAARDPIVYDAAIDAAMLAAAPKPGGE